LFFCVFFAIGCKSVIDRQDVRPRVLRDVPARNLAYRLAPDVSPPSTEIDDRSDKFAAVANDLPRSARMKRSCERSSRLMDAECLLFTAPRTSPVRRFASIFTALTGSFCAI
jgi:hypothetical protein